MGLYIIYIWGLARYGYSVVPQTFFLFTFYVCNGDSPVLPKSCFFSFYLFSMEMCSVVDKRKLLPCKDNIFFPYCQIILVKSVEGESI